MIKLTEKIINWIYRNRVIIVNSGTLKAVHDNDLETFLDSLGILKKVSEGRIKCAMCGKPVNLENIQCVFPNEGSINVCCSSSGCYEKLISWGKVVND